VLLRGKNPRPVVALLASLMAVLLLAGAAAARDVATAPGPTRVVTGNAMAAPAPDAPAEPHHAAGEPGPAVALTVHAAPTSGAAAPAAVAPPVEIRPARASPTPGPSTAVTTTVAPIPTPAPPQRTPPTALPPATPPPAATPQAGEIGPGAWRSTVEGITTTLHMTPVAPRAGQVVSFSIDTTYTADGCCVVAVYFGDGVMVPPVDNSMDCSRAPSSLHQELSHTYTRAEELTVHVQPSVFPCRFTPPAAPDPINAHLYATISIGPAS
jgi:hypothetical protein